MKTTSVKIGSQKGEKTVSEAKNQFVLQDNRNAKAQKENNSILKAKLKGHNFTFREQKQGGMINNYFQTSHNQTFNELGNPNEIRSRIPDAQRADARKEHYYLGFDKSGFKPSADQTYDFGRQNSSEGIRAVTSHVNSRNNRSMTMS